MNEPGFVLDFTSRAMEDIHFHKNSGNKKLLEKAYMLIKELRIHPFTGTGKPEQLKHELTGKWSRRINKVHRLIYEVKGDVVIIF
jgi:toxin YoeB